MIFSDFSLVLQDLESILRQMVFTQKWLRRYQLHKGTDLTSFLKVIKNQYKALKPFNNTINYLFTLYSSKNSGIT